VGLGRGPLSLVSVTEQLLGRNSSGSGVENWEYGRRDSSRWPRCTLYPQKVGTNFSDKRRSLCRYSSLADWGHGVFLKLIYSPLRRMLDIQAYMDCVIFPTVSGCFCSLLRIRSQFSSYGISYGESHSRAVFFRNFSTPLPILILLVLRSCHPSSRVCAMAHLRPMRLETRSCHPKHKQSLPCFCAMLLPHFCYLVTSNGM
jgi:hypothetical protein